jgi:hypothetical protein
MLRSGLKKKILVKLEVTTIRACFRALRINSVVLRDIPLIFGKVLSEVGYQ